MTEYTARCQLEADVGAVQPLGQPNVVPGSVETLPPLIEGTQFVVDAPLGLFTLLQSIPETHIQTRFLHTNDPPPSPARPDYGDAPALHDWSALSTAVQQLRAYLAVDTPTAGQSAAALKVTIRLVLAMARYVVGGGV